MSIRKLLVENKDKSPYQIFDKENNFTLYIGEDE